MKMIAADYALLKQLVVRVVDYNKAPDENASAICRALCGAHAGETSGH